MRSGRLAGLSLYHVRKHLLQSSINARRRPPITFLLAWYILRGWVFFFLFFSFFLLYLELCQHHRNNSDMAQPDRSNIGAAGSFTWPPKPGQKTKLGVDQAVKGQVRRPASPPARQVGVFLALYFMVEHRHNAGLPCAKQLSAYEL